MGKMKAYPDFDAFQSDASEAHRTILRALRRFVSRAAPELTESVKWGNGCWLRDAFPVAYVYCGSDILQFGFVHGSALEDPKGLLQGKAQYVRFILVRDVSDIDEPAFAALLRQADRAAAAFHAARKLARAKGTTTRQSPPSRAAPKARRRSGPKRG